MVVSKWQTVQSGSVVTLTWPHYDLLSKREVEAKVLSQAIGNQNSGVDSIFLSINDQKNSLNLMKEFGFLPAVAGRKGTLTQFGGFRNGSRDDICASAAMMLSDVFWFDNNATQPFRFAGGCIVPPNQLVIKYESSSPHNNNHCGTSNEEEGDGAATPMAHSNETILESNISLD